MKIIIISYSYTGNNNALAESLSKELSAKHFKVSTSKAMTMMTIITDMIFARTPKIQPAPDILGEYDFVLFLGPVWMGQVASPLRAYLSYLKKTPKLYGFVTISGGADGGNPKLGDELLKRTGKPPVMLIDQHTSELFSSSSQVSRKDTSAYKINDTDVMRLTKNAVEQFNKIL